LARDRYAEAYSDAPLARSIMSMVQPDEQILSIMKELMIQAGHQMDTTRGGSADAAAVMLAPKLKSH